MALNAPAYPIGPVKNLLRMNVKQSEYLNKRSIDDVDGTPEPLHPKDFCCCKIYERQHCD